MTQVLAQFRLVPFRIGGFRGEVVNLFSGVLRLVDAFDLWAVKKDNAPTRASPLPRWRGTQEDVECLNC